MIQVKNIHDEELIFTYVDTRLDVDETKQLSETERIKWAEDNEVLQAIADEKLAVILDSSTLSTLNDKLDAIKGAIQQAKLVENNAPEQPFANKVLANGQKLFRRKHGVSASIPANNSGTIELVVPYTQAKITEAEILNCSNGDKADLKVYDNSSGTISGTPDLMLNQFGFDVELPDGIYVDESNYDADLIQGMKIEITYYNNSNEARTVGVNFVLHQVVTP